MSPVFVEGFFNLRCRKKIEIVMTSSAVNFVLFFLNEPTAILNTLVENDGPS